MMEKAKKYELKLVMRDVSGRPESITESKKRLAILTMIVQSLLVSSAGQTQALSCELIDLDSFRKTTIDWYGSELVMQEDVGINNYDQKCVSCEKNVEFLNAANGLCEECNLTLLRD